MAGDWIPMRLDLAEDPAVLEMADILGEPEEYVVGCLHKIWSWASRQCHCGTVTGVTKMSLSRAVKLPKAVDAMVKVGWLIDGTGEDGRPFITFPKWENWLSKSAKARINNAINQRNSRSAKSTAVISDPKLEPKTVTGMSSKDSDKTVTTVQESTVENNNKTPLTPQGGGVVVSEEKPKQPEQPAGDPQPKRTRKTQETIGEFQIPKRLDTPEVRKALEDFETMRIRTGKRIRDRGNVCRGWDNRFVDVAHLLACIDITIANEWQGIDPKYVAAGQAAAVKKPSLWDTVKKY